MGLDAYINKKVINEKMLIIRNLGNEDITEEILYWRKDYAINEYFGNNYGLENCVPIILSVEDLKDFINFLKELNTNGENDGEYSEDIQKLKDELKGDTDNYEYSYYAWW